MREDDDPIDYDDMEQRVLQDRPRLIYAGGWPIRAARLRPDAPDRG